FGVRSDRASDREQWSRNWQYSLECSAPTETRIAHKTIQPGAFLSDCLFACVLPQIAGCASLSIARGIRDTSPTRQRGGNRNRQAPCPLGRSMADVLSLLLYMPKIALSTKKESPAATPQRRVSS